MTSKSECAHPFDAIATNCLSPRRVAELTDADVQFGLIPPEHWNQPPEIDEEKATEAREQMVRNRVIYGGSVPYVGADPIMLIVITDNVWQLSQHVPV